MSEVENLEKTIKKLAIPFKREMERQIELAIIEGYRLRNSEVMKLINKK